VAAAAVDGRNGDTHVSQVGGRQTVKAFVGDHRQLEGDSLPYTGSQWSTGVMWSNFFVLYFCSRHALLRSGQSGVSSAGRH